ncbi:MAG TPA: hypothetical protein VJP79_10430 [Nitrososphaera sp.]|nr:hypothetical protein [Nitrososphaera sp.]
MSEPQNSDLEHKLQGRTLRVYLYLQRKKVPSGIREVQRELGLSSPSVADYQVEKLVEMGLASRDGYGRVYIVRHVRVKALQSYVTVGRYMVPRLAFYATIFTAIAASYLVLSMGSANLYGVAVPAAAAGIFWFEAVKMWHVQLGEENNSNNNKASNKQLHTDNRDFWVSLVPGLAALAVFVAAAFFLFYYVAPNQLEPETFPLDPARIPAIDAGAPPVTIDELQRLDAQVESYSSHGEIVANFPPSLITGFLFAGALGAGFLVYLMVRYRCRESTNSDNGSSNAGVLVSEQ